MVSYEIPMALCILVPVIVAGSMNLSAVALQQKNGIWNWYVFHDPFTFAAFWTYFTCANGQLQAGAPFDLAEAESELVAGFHTEYSGFRWLVIFMAEYGSMFAVSGIANIMFLGGWNLGLPLSSPICLAAVRRQQQGCRSRAISSTWWCFSSKAGSWCSVNDVGPLDICCGCIDQVMMTCLKYLVPISCVLILGVSLWSLIVPAVIQKYFGFVLLALCVLGILFVIKQLASWASAPPGTGMPGMWTSVAVSGYQGAKR